MFIDRIKDSLFVQVKSNKKEETDLKILEEFFDKEWYLEKYPDVKKASIDPIKHYLEFGWKEGRNPSPSFDTRWYLERYPDVAAAGVNPLQHYVQFGRYEGRVTQDKNKRLVDPKKSAENYVAKKASDKRKYFIDKKIELDKFKKFMGGAPEKDLPVELPTDTVYLSLDIWDTVLRRKCHPDEIKLQSARYLLLTAFQYIRPAFRNVTSLYKARIKSENDSSMTEDFEYRFNEAAHRWLEIVLQSGVSEEKRESIRQSLINHELAAESSAVYADPSMLKFLQKKSYIPKIYVSDFYLDTDAINKLLRDVGLDSYFIRGYSSCEYAINKRSGKLFDFLLKELDEDPCRVTHIGDNSEADIKKPSERGINAIHYFNKYFEEQRDWFGEAFYKLIENDSSIHANRISILCEDEARSLSGDNDIAVAASKLAPLAIGFVLKIIEESKKENIKDIFFFTREGRFLKEIYDAVVKANPYLVKYPKSHLLEVSRLATFSASLRDSSIKEMMRLWNQYSIQSPKAFMSSLGLDVSIFGPMFESAGFHLEREIEYPWEDSQFVELFNSVDFQEALKRHINTQKTLLSAYLEQHPEFLENKNIMVVDLGWRGTIHDNLCYITKKHLYGVYFGLFEYLNEQPENGIKVGWLFNHSDGDIAWTISEVAPFEMLFNSCGGSVRGYRRKGQCVIAECKIIEQEDKVISQYIEPIQRTVLAMVPKFLDYVRLHGLTSQDLKVYAQKVCDDIIFNPPRLIAEAFYQLEHNEEFGTGKSDAQYIAANALEKLSSLEGNDLHFELDRLLKFCRWPEAFAQLPDVQKHLRSLTPSQQLNLPSKLFVQLLGESYSRGMKVGFFVPGPLVGSGGHRTIFNLARKFYEFGAELYIFLESEGAGIDAVHNYLQEAKAHIFTQWHKHFELDIAFATIAHSARFVYEMPRAKYKAYLIQDFEAMFNPMGDGYHIAEQSYIYPTINFTVGNWLTHVLKKQFGVSATPGGLGCDTETYFPIDNVQKEKAICFLYQPEKPRRSPQLAIHALRLVKKQHPDVKIYVYGSDAPINLDFEVENLGLIHDLKELNRLYNKCKVGLCISMSNPSRIPYELMGAGAVPIDIYRYNNLLDFPSGTALLAYQSEFSIAEAICKLLEDDNFYSERRRTCMDFVRTRTLTWEREVMFNSMIAHIAKMDVDVPSVGLLYNEPPVISSRDRMLSVDKFCEFQKKLALS